MNAGLRVALCYRCDDRDARDVYYRVAPSGLFNLHGVLRAQGLDSRLFNFSGRPWAEVGRRLAEFGPRLAGVSHFTYNHAASARLYQTLRTAAPDALVVAGGPQATFLDAELLAREPRPDIVVRGEGEPALLAIARQLARGAEDWNTIPGASWRGPAGLERTPPGPLVEDLDPLYPDQRFEACFGVNPAEQFGFVITSRGCPEACAFCGSPRFWRRRVRHRSVERVVDEIALVKRRFGLQYFGVRDDIFTGNKARVRAFCKELRRRGLGVRWNCQSRVNLVDEERLTWMKEAGCEQVQFGVEAASPRTLARLDKRITAAQIRAALAACRGAGLEAGAYFITGTPGDTDADVAANATLFDEWGLGDGVVAPLCYYPGTALFDEARRRGEVGTEIFLGGRPADLLVRRDGDARRHFEEMTALIAERRGGVGGRKPPRPGRGGERRRR